MIHSDPRSRFTPTVSVMVLTLAIAAAAPGEPLVLDFAYVPAADVQAGGPAYDFRIGRFEVRNDEFVTFLNDALANLDNERGQYMYFDTYWDNVHIHTAVHGVIGTNGSGPLLFSADVNSYVFYNRSSEAYEIAPGGESHPVTGVTWYGAVKFCNWLTIDTGLGVGQRAYTEAPAGNLNGWHPVSITTADWATRDLNDAERDELLEGLGYRLAMDGGDNTVSPYNEWFKAASSRTPGVDVVFDADFGFGRNVISAADANYIDSGDPNEPGTTPVGFYDGTDHDGTFPTNAGENAYGLSDLSGNVWEWLQDQAPSDPSQRRNRGGSWLSDEADLRVTLGVNRTSTSAEGSTGFRVVQRVLNDVLVTPPDELAAAGPWGGPYDEPLSNEITYRISNVVADTVAFTVTADAAWVTASPANGSVEPGEFADVTISLTPVCAGELVLGENVSTVRVKDLDGTVMAERPVHLTVSEPLSLTPSTALESVMPFGGTPIPPNEVYRFGSESALPVSWSAELEETVEDPWLTLPMSGEVPPRGFEAIDVGIDTAVARTFLPGTYTTDITFTDDCTGKTFVRTATLDVVAPLSVSPEDDAVSTGVFGGPFDPPSHSFTVANLLEYPVSWTVTICSEAPAAQECTPPPEPAWLEVDLSGSTLPGDDTVDVTATITTVAWTLETGVYSLTLRFEQPATGFVIDRTLSLEITGLLVVPEDDVEFLGPVGGPFEPLLSVYTLRNTGLVEMSWTASLEFDPPLDQPGNLSWLDVAPTAGVIVDDTGVDDVTVSLTAHASALLPGTYHCTIGFTANGAVATRVVTLIVGGEAFSVPTATVPAQDTQPFGPVYEFRIGRYEITNSEFAHFLNHARRNALSNIVGVPDAHSHYMYFDTDSSDVYINDQQAGEEGTEAPSGTLMTLLFDADVGGAIEFDGDEYVVLDDKENFPVGGVSWYGAVKFCNWMTLVQGMNDPDQRVYHEGPAADEWYPHAAAPDIIALRGFRLPMDDGAATASPYNEWYKAAAWIDASGSNASYGFGRAVLTSADANYLDSGDPFEPGPSPVGFYDGVNTLSDGSRTEDTNNGYDLYDMTGNLAEWVHDPGDNADERGVRGGHFNSQIGSSRLRTDGRASFPTDSTFAFLGFRVVQTIEPAELIVTQDSTRADGIVGGPYGKETFTLDIFNPGAQAVDDLSISFNVAWLEVEGVAPRQVPPGSTVQVTLRLIPTTASPGVSPPPPGNFAFVSRADTQAGGPEYDYWISRSEVTNADFASFLNTTRDNALSRDPDARSHHMYFDLDSSSVYINDLEEGEEGYDAPSVTLSSLLYDGGVGRIRFVDDAYVVSGGFGNHPVVGVTWYGAIKYCNALSIIQGIPAALTAYEEAPSPNLDGWHPVVVDDVIWASGPMNDIARQLLIEDTLGYRLPMDDGALRESLYNEWYKAASRKGLDEQGLPAFDAIYGFGRSDALTGADANYLESGDTEQDQTTPVRFFNGTNLLFQEPPDTYPPPPDPIPTRDTDNGYRLYDACGNAAEWMQDFFDNDPAQRATRGGSWRDPVDSPLLMTTGRESLPPETADDHTGFRVVRGTGHKGTVTVTDPLGDDSYRHHFILDLREPFTVQPLTGFSQQGRYGDPFAGPAESYTLTNQSLSEMDWSVTVDADWVDVAEPVSGELSGTIDGSAELTFDVELNELADTQAPGTHTATVTFRNVTTSRSQTREFELTIDPPISVTAVDPDPQEFHGVWRGPFDVLAPRSFELLSEVGVDLEYSVEVVGSWLMVEPADEADELSGALPAGSTIIFVLSVNDTADELDVGLYDGVLQFTFTDSANNGFSDIVEQEVELLVEEPIVVTESFDPWRVGPNLDPAALPSQVYTLANEMDDLPIEVMVDVDVDWVDLDVDDTAIEVLPGPGQQRTITASLNESALNLFDGEYVATLTFVDATTGIEQCRTIELTIVEELSVAPFTDFSAAGIAGGPIGPPFKVYALTNIARDGNGPIDWEVSVQGAPVGWILINGSPTAGGTLADGETANVVISIDPDQTAGLDEGTHKAVVEFRVLPDSESSTRSVSLTLVVPEFTVAEALIPATTEQPNGPAYAYKMGTYHTTNAEFAAFLNDAGRNLANERGQYMFFDTATGDVYVNSSAVGEVGPDPGGRTIMMFSPAVSGQIEFAGSAYQIVAGGIDYAQHPVTGVSWYGALKYCNWLTIDQGMLSGERCYTEDTDAGPEGWHPVTISTGDWLARDLTDDERLPLVTSYRGYRLPMDDGCNNADVTTDRADGYNEWYKAAAWSEARQRNTVFGFGRNEPLTGADANFLDSGDPFDPLVVPTTPVGYFDGSIKDGSFPTNPNENGFGVFDMTGNAYHWMQGRFNSRPDSIDFRTLRGGSWNTDKNDEFASVDLRNDSRTFYWPSLTDNLILNAQIGFRVVAAPAPSTGDFDTDGDIDVADHAAATVCLSGPGGGLVLGCGVLDLDVDGDIDLRDFAAFQIAFTGSR